MADDVLSRVKEAFSGKQGKVLLIGGGAAVVAYVWWYRTQGGGGTEVGDGFAVEEPASPVARNPQTDPTTGNQNDPGRPSNARPSNNGEWLSDASAFLRGRGVDSGEAYSALSKALAGQPTTAKEQAWVSQAIGSVGAPPEGMPPLQNAPSSGGGTTPGGGGVKPLPLVKTPPSGVKKTYIGSTAIGLQWNDMPNAKGYRIVANGKVVASPWTSYGSATGLKPNTRYTISVATVYAGNQVGPAHSMTVTTKK